MKKAGVIVVALVLFISKSMAIEPGYQLNDSKVDGLFATAQEISGNDIQVMNMLNKMESSVVSASNPNPVVATILASPWLITGTLGIHRLYLGTETGTFLAYVFTLGGCGIVSLVDFIVLVVGLVEEDVSQYVDNPKFIMWTN